MQIGGERLGRAGIEVAGTERKARTGAEKNGMVSQGKGYGGQRHGGDYEGTAGREGFGPHRYDVARCVNAGEVRQGSEAKGSAGRVEVRQARRERAGYGRVWKVPYWIDQVRQARSDAATNEMLRKDKAGGERCDQERRDGWS